jgi:hypothetical protein
VGDERGEGKVDQGEKALLAVVFEEGESATSTTVSSLSCSPSSFLHAGPSPPPPMFESLEIGEFRKSGESERRGTNGRMGVLVRSSVRKNGRARRERRILLAREARRAVTIRRVGEAAVFPFSRSCLEDVVFIAVRVHNAPVHRFLRRLSKSLCFLLFFCFFRHFDFLDRVLSCEHRRRRESQKRRLKRTVTPCESTRCARDHRCCFRFSISCSTKLQR